MEPYTAAMDPNLGPDACVLSTSLGHLPDPGTWLLILSPVLPPLPPNPVQTQRGQTGRGTTPSL